MATKILFNGNRIIIDGHADTAEECRAITAMCDTLKGNENFKTIVYEEGHAVFEQVSGGESEMFATMADYVLTSRYNSETGYSAAELATKGTIAYRLGALEKHLDSITALMVEHEAVMSDKIDKSARVKGVWVINEDFSLTYADHGISQSLNFTAFASSEDTEPTSYNKITLSGSPLNLGTAYGSHDWELCYGSTKVWSGASWTFDTLRTIDFGSEPQACSEDFANWLTANATAGDGAEVEILKSSQERLEELEAIFPATAEVGQYLKVSAVDENGKITALEAVSQAEYKLPYTASELAEKLGQI